MAGSFHWKNIKARYTRFAEKQGFAIIATLCVAVITGTAVWTKKAEVPYVAPTPPNVQDVSAAQLMQQPLAEAVRPSPAPTETPVFWQWPVKGRILRSFDDARMVQSGITGIWAVHDGVDIAAEKGAPIAAMADGTVVSCGEDGLDGAWVTLDHGDSLESTCTGLAMLAAIQPGDAIRAGQTVGFAGDGPLSERDLPAHIHLRITKNGRAIDPMGLLAPSN